MASHSSENNKTDPSYSTMSSGIHNLNGQKEDNSPNTQNGLYGQQQTDFFNRLPLLLSTVTSYVKQNKYFYAKSQKSLRVSQMIQNVFETPESRISPKSRP